MTDTGTLYIVATPVGNLGDITSRALEVLAAVDHIAAEDTRETRKLLTHFRIPAAGRLVSYYRDNERRRVPHLVRLLEGGRDIALVSSRGTPGVSDPSSLVVAAAHERGIRVVPVPGPSALAAALSVCGLPADRVLFLGFLPRRPGKRRRLLESLREADALAVIYESPYRLLKTLAELETLLGTERTVTVCRELTKAFEEVKSGPLGRVRAFYEAAPVRGEFIIMVKQAGRAGRITRQPEIPDDQDAR